MLGKTHKITNTAYIDAGFKALFLTVDAPYLGRRLNEFRNDFSMPKGMEFPNLFPGVDVSNLEGSDDNSMEYGMDILLPF
jgi:(S)-2-hydroxy-acid oxidase